jgi:hypothetical protein
VRDSFELGFERAFSLGGTQGINHVDSVDEQDAIAVLARGIAECGGQVFETGNVISLGGGGYV